MPISSVQKAEWFGRVLQDYLQGVNKEDILSQIMFFQEVERETAEQMYKKVTEVADEFCK